VPRIEAAGLADIERHAAAWDALADAAGAPPFLRPGWVAAWWRAFGRGRLELLTSERDGRLAAVLPVVHRPPAAISPTNWHTPVFGLLSADADAAAEVADRLFGARRGLVSLGFLPAEGGELRALAAAAQAARYRLLLRVDQRSPSVAVRGDWTAFERSLSSNLRGDLGRCRRRLAEGGKIALDVVHEPDGLDAGLAEAFAIEQSGWKATRRTAIASQPRTAMFYAEVARWAARRGALRLVFLRTGGQAVAFHLALEDGGRYLPLKGAFHPGWAACSPGRLIIHATLRRAFDLGLDRYEFLGAAEPYKRRWATDERVTMRFQAFAPSPAGVVGRTAFAYGRPLVKRALALAR
jgi:CelD/BcsL family acetyltransferase involved in cellulose biosynthesis